MNPFDFSGLRQTVAILVLSAFAAGFWAATALAWFGRL